METIEEVYQKYAKIVYKYLLCLCKDPDLSEELTQETFAIAVDKISTFRGNCQISVWLCQIAKHLLYKESKKRKKHNIISLDEIKEIHDENIFEDEIMNKQDRIEIINQIQTLDTMVRKVMYLRIKGELSFKEIGKIVNKTENWTRVMYYRGKQKIKEERKRNEKGM